MVVVVPARRGSVRYPGKPLAMLRGAGGEAKPLVVRSREAAVRSGAARVIVATDCEEIAAVVRAAGGEAMLTSAQCRNGTERCAEVLARLDPEPALIVNLQGDAPLTPPALVRAVAARALAAGGVATPVVRASARPPGGVSAVADGRGRALYFSRALLPWGAHDVLTHVGLYAYTPDALRAYADAGPCAIEEAEQLEQLRFLHLGVAVHLVVSDAGAVELREVNAPGDVQVVEAGLVALGID